jgi:20S proteasome alpha/beta subunit
MLMLKPLPLVKPTPRIKRLPRRKGVTIAAGYLCDTGIILCADTQESIQGFVKTSTEKVKLFSGKSYTIAFAGAGDNSVQIDMVVQEICDELREEEPPSLMGFKVLLHGVLDRLFPQPHYPKANPEVELILAVKEGQRTHLFVVFDNVFAESFEYDCVGSGVVLAKSMLQQHWKRNYSLIEAYIISAYILYHAKRWVDGCGGKSDIFLLPNDTENVTRLGTEEIKSLESYFDLFDSALRPLLVACPSEPQNDAKFKSQLAQSNQNLWAARAGFQDFEQVFKRLAQEAGMDGDETWAAITDSVDQFLKQPSPFPAPSPTDSSQ